CNTRTSLTDKSVEEEEHLEHIRYLPLVLGADGVDAAANEDPKGLLNKELRKCRLPVRKESLLLIKGQQACREIDLPLLFALLLREVQDRIILPVTVLVEIFVGIIEEDALGVFLGECGFVGRLHRLAKGRRVFEGESLLA